MIAESSDVTDPVVLVTGASSGFGKVIAVTLAEEGYRVFAGMRELHGRNAGVARDLGEVGARHPIAPVEIDVTSDSSVSFAVGSVLDAACRIDVSINSAGVMWLGNTEAFSVAQFESLLQTNLVGSLRLFKAVLPGMRERRDGLLITISSVVARIVPPGFGIYAASKMGLEGLAEALGYEVSGLGIDSVIIEPGSFPDTNLRASQRDPADREVVAAYGEFGRFREHIQERAKAAAGTTPMRSDVVAQLVLDVIRTPKGRRPVRTTVGGDFGVQELNETAQHHQRRFLDALGLVALERVAPELARWGHADRSITRSSWSSVSRAERKRCMGSPRSTSEDSASTDMTARSAMSSLRSSMRASAPTHHAVQRHMPTIANAACRGSTGRNSPVTMPCPSTSSKLRRIERSALRSVSARSGDRWWRFSTRIRVCLGFELALCATERAIARRRSGGVSSRCRMRSRAFASRADKFSTSRPRIISLLVM